MVSCVHGLPTLHGCTYQHTAVLSRPIILWIPLFFLYVRQNFVGAVNALRNGNGSCVDRGGGGGGVRTEFMCGPILNYTVRTSLVAVHRATVCGKTKPMLRTLDTFNTKP